MSHDYPQVTEADALYRPGGCCFDRPVRRDSEGEGPGSLSGCLEGSIVRGVIPWTDEAKPVYRFVASTLPELPDPVKAVTSMLSYEERALLYELARQSQGRGAIVDAGCFLGGSTLSLAMGVAASSSGHQTPIHSYDRFTAEWGVWGYSSEVDGLSPGSSIRPIFEQNIEPYRQMVTVHEGDLLEEKWPGEPIEILFVDICKSWELNAHVVREFFSALIPQTSVIVQQDLVHWGHPWCAIVMEYLSDYFEYLGWTWFGSSAWRCISVPPAGALQVDWKGDVGLDMGLELLRQSARRHTGWAVPYLELSQASLMRQFGAAQEARDQISRVEEQYGTSVPYLEQGYRMLRDSLSTMQDGG